MRRKHLLPPEGISRGTATGQSVLYPTPGAVARYEPNTFGGNVWHDIAPVPQNATASTAIEAVITNITQASAGVVTTAAEHGFLENTRVILSAVNGMTQVNGNIYTVKNPGSTTFELHDLAGANASGTSPVNTSGFSAYTSGGKANQGNLNFPVFNGVCWARIGTPAKLDFADAYTIQVWSKQNVSDPPIQSSERIVSRDPGAGTRNLLISSRDNTGQVDFISFPGGGIEIAQSSAGISNDNKYHHIVAVNEGASKDLLLYVDGALEVTLAGKGGPMSWNSTSIWEFGRWQSGNDLTQWYDMFQGEIDSCRFYSTVLSAEQILNDYRAGSLAHS